MNAAWARDLTNGNAPYIAQGDLSNHQYMYVKLGTEDRTVTAITSATDEPLGILQNSPPDGAQAVVRILGESPVRAGADLAVGQKVGTDGTGLSIPKTSAGQFFCGRVIGRAASGGDLGTVIIDRGFHP